MSIAEIENRILEEAAAEAGKIKEEAVVETEKIKAEAQKRAEALSLQIMETAQKKAGEEKKALLVPARLEAKKKILEEKHKIMDEVFAGFSPEVREKKEIEAAKFLYG